MELLRGMAGATAGEQGMSLVGRGTRAHVEGRGSAVLQLGTEARLTVGRIISQVERRELTQGDATELLRDVAHRLAEARLVEEAAHASRADAPLHLG